MDETGAGLLQARDILIHYAAFLGVEALKVKHGPNFVEKLRATANDPEVARFVVSMWEANDGAEQVGRDSERDGQDAGRGA